MKNAHNDFVKNGDKQNFLADLARKVMKKQLKQKDLLVFSSSLTELRRSMIRDLVARKIFCKFSSSELQTALTRNSVFAGEVSISNSKDGMQLITAYSTEMKHLVEILRPLASDFQPDAADQGAGVQMGHLRSVPYKKVANDK